MLLGSPAAAQRDPEVDVRARLFAEVGAGVAAIKSRTVPVGQTSRSAPIPDQARAAAPTTDSAKPQASAASAPSAPSEEKLYYLLIPALRTEGAEAGGATVLVFRDDGTRVAQIPAPPAALRAKSTQAGASAPSGTAAAGGAATGRGPSGSGAATDASAAGATVADLQAVPPAPPLVVYGHDFDVDAQGRVFIADRAANAVKIFNADGTPAGAIRVAAPTSVAALANGEVAVTSLRGAKLVTVYAERPAVSLGSASALATSGASSRATTPAPSAAKAASAPEASTWRAIREFGEPADIADPDAPADLKRFLNLGRLARDPDNHIYYAFAYAPEPTVRKYDAFGYKLYETELATLDFFASAQSARRNIDRLGQSRFSLGAVINPGFTATVTALAADPATQELWVALGGQLLHFGPDGIRRQTYRLFTRDGIRVEASAILVEPDRLIIASDTQGVFEFPRPDKSRRPR
ncbi:MAG: hypothetical protein ACRD5G_14490 [Candidatus Acidiferrales bacterium]